MDGKLEVNMDALLAGTLDDLVDLPEFKAFVAGAHRSKLHFEVKKINKHPSVELTLTLIETLEQVDATEAPMQKGTETSIAYMLDNEVGQGKFKELIKLLAAKFGPMSNGEMLKAAEGAEVIAVTSVRQNKDKTASYTDLTNVAFE